MKGRKWTKEEDDLMLELYVKPDVMSSEIAQRVGRSRSSIYSRAATLGLKAPAEKASIAGKMPLPEGARPREQGKEDAP